MAISIRLSTWSDVSCCQFNAARQARKAEQGCPLILTADPMRLYANAESLP